MTLSLPKFALIASLIAGSTLLPLQTASACSRAVYFGQQGQTVTGRSLDWVDDMQTNLWIFPRGMTREGSMGGRGLKWASKYGSVIAAGHDASTTDGMNERGLVANLLFLTESEYPGGQNDPRPLLAVSAWAQYVLDNFATVSEAVAEMRKEAFRPVMVTTPNGIQNKVNLAVSDVSGDSAIFEYVGGKLVIHHSRHYQVITNAPAYGHQLAQNEYWRQVGGTVMLPGTSRPADRFARASFYINAVRQTAEAREAVAAVFSVMRNVSVPRGVNTIGMPSIAPTVWRSVADQKNRIYYFEDTAGPGALWVKLGQIDFNPPAGVRKLTLQGNPGAIGDQTGGFRPAPPFAFMAPR